ncbi:MAG: tRNA (cytidine(34)-2'-O)-methyltransferase [Gemmataceae bacterium]
MSTSLLHVALWEPEIPPNTGNIARTCAALDLPLHLIGKLGFLLDEKSLRRAGLDYWKFVKLQCHDGWTDFKRRVISPDDDRAIRRIVGFSARATTPYTSFSYQRGDCLLFGNESSGLPDWLKDEYAETMATVPMLTPHVRSLNLATTAGIVIYEALRQLQVW